MDRNDQSNFVVKQWSITLRIIIQILTISLLIACQSAFAAQIDLITVSKKDRELILWKDKKIYQRYPVKLSISYNNPLFRPGPKLREGDNQTPVGFYKISKKRTRTRFPKSLLISYPNWKDRHNARVRGMPENELGGMILIHGAPYRPNAKILAWAKKWGIDEEQVDSWARDYLYPNFDWTNGCIALSDQDMDQVFSLINKGTPISIYP
jgi:murein L,D-transpeptidase YafK